MLKNIKVTITNDGSEITKYSESNVTENLGTLQSQLKAIRESVNTILSNLIGTSSGDNNTCPDNGEDDDESEDNEDDNNDKETFVNGRKKSTLKRSSEDKQNLPKKVKH